MNRLLILVLALTASCTWPPRPSVPPVAQNPDEAADEALEPALRTPAPTLPRVSPPPLSVPRVGGRGLL
ncbi:MAG: hypothetical protein ACREQY_06285 [Candidatus Binatia bacterium]